MGCFLGCGRFLLIFVNTVIMIGAFAMAGLGAATVFVGGGIFNYIIYAFPTIEKLDKALEDTGLGDDTTYDSFALDKAFTAVAMAFVVIGALVVIVTMIGCCGGCCKSKCCLSTNAAILIFLLVLEIIAILLIYSDESLIKTPLRKYTKKSAEKYKGFPGYNLESFAWNFGMVKWNCCGVINYEDFEKADQWNRTLTTDSGTYTLEVPITCCNPLPTSKNLTCATTTTGTNAEKGCFDTLWNKAFGNRSLAALAYAVGFTLQNLSRRGDRDIPTEYQRFAVNDEACPVVDVQIFETKILLIMFSVLICLNEPNKVNDYIRPYDFKPHPIDTKPRLPATKIHAINMFSTKIKPKE